jgi:dihydropteroate synthase
VSTRVYLRPTGFIDAPFGHDGQALRLAGGLQWFSAVELITSEDGQRRSTELVPVERLEARIAALPAPQAAEAEAFLARLLAPRPALALGERVIRLDQPQVMAILNLTPDSFSDGGRHFDDPAGAADAATAMAAAGAAIIDIGGESTRPGSQPVWEGDQTTRVLPVIERLAQAGVAMSIDTRNANVAAAALQAGAAMVNDVSAGKFDPRMLDVVARAGCPIVLMHHQGQPETMQHDPRYDDVLLDVYDWLEDQIATATAAGVAKERILVDPGVGFGKTLRHNLTVLNGLALFHGLGCPVVLGASRKRLVGALAGEAPADKRLPGSLALAVAGATQGIQILRVHDAEESVQALRVWRGLRDSALTP